MWWLTVCLCCLSVVTLVSACPPHCYCYSDEDGLKTANCSLVGLHHGGSAPQLDVLNFRSSLRGYHTKLEPRLFATFKSIKILNLFNSSIVQLPNDVFQGLTNVLEIDLSYNKIRHLNGVVFKDLPSLSSLILRGNLLVLSPFDVIVSKTLDELDMGYCGLSKIPLDTFKGVPNLSHLTLDGNHLHNFAYHTLPSGLRYLNLDYNRFVHVPTDVFLSMRSLRRINLGHNPINCTCQLLIFQDRFSDDGRLVENVICAGPPQIEGKKLSRVNENHICRMEMLAKESRLNTIKHSTLAQDQPVQADQPLSDEVGDYSSEVMFSNNDTVSYGSHRTSTFTDSGTDNKVEEPDKYSRSMKEPTQDLEGGTTNEEFETIADEVTWTGESRDENENDNNVNNNPSTMSDSAADPSNNVHALDVGNRTTEGQDSMIASGSTIDQVTYEDDSSNNTSDYNYDAQHPEYASSVSLEEETHPSTVPVTSEKTEEEEDWDMGSGDGETSPIFDKNSSTPIWMEEQENETSTVAYKIEEVTHVFDIEPSTTSPSTEPPTTLVPSSSETPSPSPEVEVMSTSSSTEEPTISSTAIVETETISTTVPTVEILQNGTGILQRTEDFKMESEPAKKPSPLVDLAYVYGLAVVAVLLLLLLIIITVCRRRNHVKVRLPQDTEANIDTEMQDMLLPKPPENGIKVLPKNYTNGKSTPLNGKPAESLTHEEESTPILTAPTTATTNGTVMPSPPPRQSLTVVEDPTSTVDDDHLQQQSPPPTPPPSTDDWPPKLSSNGVNSGGPATNGDLHPEPIETVKARMTVLARPQTPIYIHKTLN